MQLSCSLTITLACSSLYLANAFMHAFFFSKHNPAKRPGQQTVLILISRMSFGLPTSALVCFWLALWICFWEMARAPLWKPRNSPLAIDNYGCVEMCGGGFRTWYHLGVYWGLYDKFGKDGMSTMRFSGSSVGALVATVAACGVHPADIWAHIPAIANSYRETFLSHVTGVGQFCRFLLHSTLPPDAHLLVNGRLFISVSSLFPTPFNRIISEFDSRQDLIDAVIAAQYIPTWTYPGICFYRGMICVDGGVTNNLPNICVHSLRVGLDKDDTFTWNADFVPSQPLSRLNTFIPAQEASLQRMLDCGKDDINDWLNTCRGISFIQELSAVWKSCQNTCSLK